MTPARSRSARWVAPLAAAACVGAALAPPAAAVAEPARASGWVITRTGPGPAVLSGWFTGRARSSTATAVLFALTGSGAARTRSSAFTTARIDWGGDLYPRVYGQAQPGCSVACVDPIQSPIRFGFSSNGRPTAARIYVATWDATSTIELTSPGWQARPWTPVMRTVEAHRAGDRGVQAVHVSAGRFQAADAPGGRYGSLAWAVLPCDYHGAGSATLTGGSRAKRLDCERQPIAWEDARGATQWRLRGDAEGAGFVVNVLVVVDYPRD